MNTTFNFPINLFSDFANVYNMAVENFEENNGKRKRIMNLSVIINLVEFNIDINKKDNIYTILNNILKEGKKYYKVWNHANMESIDYYSRAIENLKEIIFENNKITFKSDLHQEEKMNFVKELKDSSNIKEYIFTLEKYSNIIDLEYYKSVKLNFTSRDYYKSSFSSYGNDNILDRLNGLLEKVKGCTNSTILGIEPTNLKNLNWGNIHKIDLLSFNIIESENDIKNYNERWEQRGTEIERSYGENRGCGNYVGD